MVVLLKLVYYILAYYGSPDSKLRNAAGSKQEMNFSPGASEKASTQF